MPCAPSKESYLDSYNVVVDTLKQEHPTLSDHDIRVRAAQQFRPIFRTMEIASSVENAGNKEYENGEFALTQDGDMYFPNTGVTVEQLHTNQLRSSEIKRDPTKYSLVDHQITRLIQHAFANGATVVRTSFPRDGQDNRDILEYSYDRATNKGVIKVINAAPDGAYHDFDRIKEIARQQSPHLTEVTHSRKVFVLTDAAIQQDTAQSVIRAVEHQFLPIIDKRTITPREQDRLASSTAKKEKRHSTVQITDHQPTEKDSPEKSARGSKRTPELTVQVEEAVEYVTRRILKDTHETTIGISLYFLNRNRRQEAKKRILDLPVLQHVRRVFLKDGAIERSSNDKRSFIGEYKSIVQPNRSTDEAIREKPVSYREATEKHHKEIRQGMVALAVITETRVALGAASILLALLAKESPPPIRALEKSVRRHQKRELKIKNKELRRKIREVQKDLVKAQPFKARRVEHLVILKERKKLMKRVYFRIPNGTHNYIIEYGRRMKRREAERKRKGTERRGGRVVERPKEKVAKETKTVRAKKTQRGVEADQEKKKMQEKRMSVRKEQRREAVLLFSLAWMLWFLLRMPHRAQQFDYSNNRRDDLVALPRHISVYRESNAGRKSDKKDAVVSKKAVSEPKALVRQEGAPWILLSIIWYLAMVRENKISNIKYQISNMKKNKTKRQKAIRNQWPMPPRGIIFAFNS